MSPELPPEPHGHPCLEGLTIFLSEEAIGRYVGRTQPTIWMWRQGKTHPRPAQVIYLNSILAMAIESAEEGLVAPQFTAVQKMMLKARVEAGKRWFAAQKYINDQLPPEVWEEARKLDAERHEALSRPPALRARRQKRPQKTQKNETRTPQELGGIEGAGSVISEKNRGPKATAATSAPGGRDATRN